MADVKRLGGRGDSTGSRVYSAQLCVANQWGLLPLNLERRSKYRPGGLGHSTGKPSSHRLTPANCKSAVCRTGHGPTTVANDAY
jgi:hypothetical protein